MLGAPRLPAAFVAAPSSQGTPSLTRHVWPLSRPALSVRLEPGVFMSSKDFRAHTETRSLCADLHSDDGPPTRRRKESRDDRSDDRKTRQLCAQVRRALHGVIPQPGSSFLDGLVVEAVEPDPDVTRLRVVIGVPPTCRRPVDELKRRLGSMAGFARSQVALGINRKRVPLLVFELVPSEGAR